MIKLIATDMDGTLLNDKKQLPPDFFEVLDELFSRGVRFAVASGRSYTAVSHLFPQRYAERMDFICDNGAHVVHGGKTVSVSALEHDTYVELINACGEIGGVKVVVCARGGTYHLAYSPEFDKEVEKFYINHRICGDLLAVNDTIYKIAVCDMLGSQEHAKPIIDASFGGRLNVQVSGKIWMDVMAAGVNKGKGLAELCGALEITPEQTMAFGDYYNDSDMLKFAGWSFAPANAHEDIKKLARYVCESNNDCGVTRAIRKYALNGAV